ncbi:MAG: choice-of-anchor C family protein [Syntrophaceae bacterium]|nr:choice-of-anchor C family protein [Syntrophaceae bacterium]
MRKPFTVALIVTLLATPAGADILNGSFENGSYPGGVFSTLYYGDMRLSDWAVGGNSIDWIDSYWQPAEGSRSIDLSGNGPGSLSQQFGTVPGTTYRVTFAMAGNPDGGEAIKDLRVTAIGIGSGDYAFDTTGKTRTAMGWDTREFVFTARAYATTLVFESLETDAYGPALDAVAVNAVPLPPAAWLLGSGLIGLVAVRRRRQTKAPPCPSP